ncbi:MAG TPA: hypothetical protein V6D03_10725 [Candidatus Caenarcaniphilales bacterium]
MLKALPELLIAMAQKLLTAMSADQEISDCLNGLLKDDAESLTAIEEAIGQFGGGSS